MLLFHSFDLSLALCFPSSAVMNVHFINVISLDAKGLKCKGSTDLW